jgi:hypothetical protein
VILVYWVKVIKNGERKVPNLALYNTKLDIHIANRSHISIVLTLCVGITLLFSAIYCFVTLYHFVTFYRLVTLTVQVRNVPFLFMFQGTVLLCCSVL